MTDNFEENKTVARLAEITALNQGYSPAKSKQIRIAAALHDIGKQKISGEILNKPGKLNKREFEIIKTHTIIGEKMLESIQGDIGDMARHICCYHHEWRNGKGYWGVPSDYLPRYVEIVAVCDVFTALLYKRIYKPAWPPEEALQYIQNQAGTQFCPELARDFITLVRTDSRVSAIFAELQPHEN